MELTGSRHRARIQALTSEDRRGDVLVVRTEAPAHAGAFVVMGVKAEDVPEDVLRWMASNRVENTG